MDIWQEFRDRLSEVSNDTVISGKDFKDVLFSIIDYAEFETSHRENMYRMLVRFKDLRPEVKI